MAIFIEKGGVFTPPRTPKVCRTWLIWALNPTYKSPLRNWKKIWPLWEICAPKNEFSPKKWQFLLNKWGGFTPPGPPRFAGHGLFGPKILPTSLLWETKEKNHPHMTLKANVQILYTKKSTFWKSECVIPLQFPQFLPGMAHMDPILYVHVHSEVLKKNSIFILNLVHF